MTPAEVLGRLHDIGTVANDDPEVAHAREDKLRADVLSAIATGDTDNPQQLARLALQSRFIVFPRWAA